MVDFISFGLDLISVLQDLRSALFEPFYIVGVGNVTVAGLVIGGSLFGVLSFKAIKFYTDIIL